MRRRRQESILAFSPRKATIAWPPGAGGVARGTRATLFPTGAAERPEMTRGMEVGALALGRLGRFLVVAPLRRLPVLVESGQTPERFRVELVARRRKAEDERPRQREQVVKRGQLEGRAGEDVGRHRGERRRRLLDRHAAARGDETRTEGLPAPVEHRIPGFGLRTDKLLRSLGAIAEEVRAAIG